MAPSDPRSSDATLGGQAPPPRTSAVLGGIEGAKQRLENEAIAIRLAALKEAFQYDRDQASELAVQALSDPSIDMQQLATRLLRRQGSSEGKQALLNHQPLDSFTTLANWRQETYTSQVGITDPENNAYSVPDFKQLEPLLNDLRLTELQALVVEANYNYPAIVQAICQKQDQLTHLQALQIADTYRRYTTFGRSESLVSEISKLLNTFPQLEVLHIYGSFGDDRATEGCADLQHEHLKSLIIETADMTPTNLERLCSMHLPELEYLEIWFGRKSYYRWDLVALLQPILTAQPYPKLRYLGLCNSEDIEPLPKKWV